MIIEFIKILIQNGMYREATELINANMLPKTLFTELYTEERK